MIMVLNGALSKGLGEVLRVREENEKDIRHLVLVF